MENSKEAFEKHIVKLLEDEIFGELDRVYVELSGQENINEIEVFSSTVIDAHERLLEEDNLGELSDYEGSSDGSLDKNAKERRIDSILKIANDTKHFVVIGQPGSGKTMTLLKICHDSAKSVLRGDAGQQIPFYIHANEFGTDNTFLDMLSKNTSREWACENLSRGRLQILIDGLNEINEKYKKQACDEINSWLSGYRENSIIISERKVHFERCFDIPVFEMVDLNECQVSAFIKNYSGKYSGKIWDQLKQDTNLLKLCYSPLMLKMILSVSKNGMVPQSRGLLYELFINSIFQREKEKQQQVPVGTKRDVLSLIAFEMRKAGYVSLSIAEFKHLIAEKLKDLNSTVSATTVFDELLDNLLIKISQNKNVSFFHETYQEYFCAVQLKRIYETSGELCIDFKEKTWFEALLLCHEIIKDNQQAVSFFKYIFKGQKETERQKPIDDFDPSDFNGEGINLACAIACSVKPLRPDIYGLAEKYLSNYLILWKDLFLRKGISAMPIWNLFAAVASLDSRKLIHHLVHHLSWATIWLYGEDEDQHGVCALQYTGLAEQTQIQKISNAICDNTPDFTNFYDIIGQSLEEYQFCGSIYRRLRNLRKKLLNSQSENQLKQYYQDKPEHQVFLAILKHDIDAVKGYCFAGYDISRNSGVLKTLIDFHITKKLAWEIILRELGTFLYHEKLIHLAINKLYEFNQLSGFCTFMEFFLENGNEIYSKHMPKLQAIPFSLLTEKLQGQFVQFGHSTQVPFRFLEGNKLIINKKDGPHIFVNETYSVNKGLDVLITGLLPIKHKGGRAVLLSNQEVEPTQTFPEQGMITIHTAHNKIDLPYSGCRITKSKDKWEFGLSNFKEETVKLQITNCNITVNNENGWFFHHWSVQEIEDEENLIVTFKTLCSAENISEIPGQGSLSLLSSKLDVKSPSKYHPDILVSDRGILSMLKRNLTMRQYLKFIGQVGITSYFHKELPDVHYGIIICYYERFLKIYSLKHHEFIEMVICQDDLSAYQPERIVVIENDLKVNLLNEEDEDLDRIGYITSEILYVDGNKSEGFILKKDYPHGSDYFFHFDSCDFVPKVGDIVKFLPALNSSRNYINEPIALRVSKVLLRQCRILHVDYLYASYNCREMPVVGKAIDIVSGELLFFRIYPKHLQDVKNSETPIKENQVFEYVVIKEEQEDQLKIIRLVGLSDIVSRTERWGA